MHLPSSGSKRTLAVVFLLIAILLPACGTAPASQTKSYTIGIVHYDPPLDSVLDGFKTKMKDLGYVEGQNITYVFHGRLKEDSQVIDAEVKSLLAQKVDLLFTLGNPTTLAAKKAVEGTTTPVVFAPTIDPVGAGLVASVSHPGGNVTGVQRSDVIAKAMEWLLKVTPGAKKVYVPYNPADMIAVTAIKPIPDVATKLGVELTLGQVHSSDEAVTAIKALSKDSVVFLVPVPTLVSGAKAMFQAAIDHGIAFGTSYTPDDVAAGALIFYGSSFYDMGQQAAQLADKVLKGAKPADLPVETDEAFLGINLKTAQAIGISITDDVLRQAKTIVR